MLGSVCVCVPPESITLVSRVLSTDGNVYRDVVGGYSLTEARKTSRNRKNKHETRTYNKENAQRSHVPLERARIPHEHRHVRIQHLDLSMLGADWRRFPGQEVEFKLHTVKRGVIRDVCQHVSTTRKDWLEES